MKLILKIAVGVLLANAAFFLFAIAAANAYVQDAKTDALYSDIDASYNAMCGQHPTYCR